MKILTSNIDNTSKEFLEKKSSNLALLTTLRTRLDAVTKGGSQKAREKHLERGKLLVRDRINLLVDPNTPFLELSPLAATD